MNLRYLLSFLPLKLQQQLFYKFLNSKQEMFKSLFQAVPLKFAPSYTMHQLVVGDVISGQIAMTGFYELELSQELQKLSQKGGIFVDVGANLGYFSLLWLHGNPSNRVIAIEASPRNQAALLHHAIANQVESRITLINKAAGDQNRTVIFELGPEQQTGWGGISSNHSDRSSDLTIEVEMVRLDRLLIDLTGDAEIAVMKIDVEGADTLVLKGCEQLLKKKSIHTIFFEQNLVRMQKLNIQPKEALDLLDTWGYECKVLGNTQNEFVATKKL